LAADDKLRGLAGETHSGWADQPGRGQHLFLAVADTGDKRCQ
jgi:hypothetical protein